MDDVPRDALPSLRLLVIVCSTTGDGTTPDNMKSNYRALLRKSLPPTFLAGVRFAIFGLGDSSYAKYNASARRLWVRLQQLGATPLLTDPGLGDDQEQLGYDAALQPWAEALWTRLLARDALPLPPDVVPKRDGLMPPRFRVEEIEPPSSAAAAAAGDDMQIDDADGSGGGGVFSSKRPYLAEISSVTRVTPADHFQDVRLVRIELGDSGLSHPPGAVLSIMPRCENCLS
jgi:sulfite reductase alpha subunit-like flavoprotein